MASCRAAALWAAAAAWLWSVLCGCEAGGFVVAPPVAAAGPRRSSRPRLSGAGARRRASVHAGPPRPALLAAGCLGVAAWPAARRARTGKARAGLRRGLGGVVRAAEERMTLGDFRLLLGNCYGVASVLHLVDIFGANTLPSMVGAPPFAELPAAAQVAELVWCGAGAVAVLGTRLAPGAVGDACLAFFALYEAWLVAAGLAAYGSGLGMQPFLNVVVAQGLALAAYLYCAKADEGAKA